MNSTNMDQQEQHHKEHGADQEIDRSRHPQICPDQIASPLAILSIDDGVVMYANDEFRRIIKSTKVGEPLKGFLSTPEKRQSINKKLEQKFKCVSSLETQEYTLRFSVTKGEFVEVQHYFLTLEKSYEKSEHGGSSARTNCLDRENFVTQVTQLLTNTEDGSTQACMCAIDIDRFKVVNEKHGYAAGDYILKQLLELIEENIPVSHLIGRLGDNEFGLVLQGLNIDEAVQLSEVIREQIKTNTFIWQGEEIAITVSIGVISVDFDKCKIEDVLAQLTLALISAQENGRDCVHSSATQDTMMAYHSGKMHYAMVIEDALQNDKFELFAQPIVSLQDTDTYYSYEVLLRIYDHKKEAFVSSQELITAAESLEVTTRIDRWVCKKVFELLNNKINQQVRIPNISINLSGHSIVSVAFERFLLELTEKYDVPTSCICFEITESVAVKSITRAQNFIHNLKEVGYRFSLDDFGVGYCSFNYLNKLDVDNVKIDGSFVSAMLDDATQFATVQAITNVARTMNIKTIAEFVEKPEIIKALKVIGVDYGQGYLFGKPSAIQDIF